MQQRHAPLGAHRLVAHRQSLGHFVQWFAGNVVRHQDLVIPPELRKKAPRYKRWKNTADPVMQKLVDPIADDFRNYWRIDAAIEEGKWQLNAAEAEKLINKISADTKAALDHLKANSHKIKVDNPY